MNLCSFISEMRLTGKHHRTPAAVRNLPFVAMVEGRGWGGCDYGGAGRRREGWDGAGV